MKWFNKDFTVSLEWTSYRLTRSLRVLYSNATAQLIRETTSQLKSREINFVILVLDEMAKKKPSERSREPTNSCLMVSSPK